MTTETLQPSTWRALLRGANGRIALVLSGGVAAYAVTTYITGAVLPALASELDGDRLYAWVNTAFLAASVIGSASASPVIGRLGIRASYLLAFGLFSAGSAVIAASWTMEGVVAGRAVQGVGGGLLTALAYVAISALLPESLWGRATGLVTAMWAIGGVGGPALGGLFGTPGLWRVPFVILTACALALAVVSRFSVASATVGAADDSQPRRSVAAPSIVVALLAVSALSVAALFDGPARLAWGAAGILLLALFLVVDSRTRVSMLPKATYARGSRLRWVYLLVAVLAGSVMIEAFIPLFGHQLGLPPFAAGYLGAVPSIGWTVAQFASVSVTAPATRAVLRIVGPLVTLAGFVTLAATGGLGGPWMLWWIPALAAIGTGVGLAFPHLAVAAMSMGRDDADSARTSAGISVVQLLSNTVFTAFCGLLLTTGIGGITDAQAMAAGLAIVVAIGAAVGLVGLRRTR